MPEHAVRGRWRKKEPLPSEIYFFWAHSCCNTFLQCKDYKVVPLLSSKLWSQRPSKWVKCYSWVQSTQVRSLIHSIVPFWDYRLSFESHLWVQIRSRWTSIKKRCWPRYLVELNNHWGGLHLMPVISNISSTEEYHERWVLRWLTWFSIHEYFAWCEVACLGPHNSCRFRLAPRTLLQRNRWDLPHNYGKSFGGRRSFDSGQREKVLMPSNSTSVHYFIPPGGMVPP